MKKTIYIILAAFLGLILSFIAHAAIEMIYLGWAASHNVAIKSYFGTLLIYFFKYG